MIAAVDRTQRAVYSSKGLHGFYLFGKTIGVIGTGSIGRCVIEIAEGFRMEVLTSDARPDQDMASHLGFRCVKMGELPACPDFITLHVPFNEYTRVLYPIKNLRA